jgi:hypothetical protein
VLVAPPLMNRAASQMDADKLAVLWLEYQETMIDEANPVSQ